MNKAIFLDRDGVINHPVFNPRTNEYEAPHNETDFLLFPGVIESLKELHRLNYKLFLVSNQPDYAKGKASLESLHTVHKRMHKIFLDNNINFTEYFYCYHHPLGIVPEYSVICQCRKPGDLFLQQACLKYSLDLSDSWMIGDRDIDVFCGQSVSTKTILVYQKHSENKAGQSKPDYRVNSLKEAVEIIKKANG